MRLTVQGHLQAAPLSRFSVEVFASHQRAGAAEGEIFLGEVVTTTDAGGRAQFTLVVDSVLGGTPTTYTATVISSGGATSEFSQPLAASN